MSHQNSHHAKAGIPIGAFAVGALAGALAGILLAPKSGKETRADIQDTVMKMKDDLTEKLMDLKEVTEDKYKEIAASVVATYEKSKAITTEQAHEIKEDLMDGYDELKKAAKDAKDDMDEHV
jgi:gas vesicle protein